MATDLKILTARRGYEYPADALRLTVLTLPHVIESIRSTFNFQGAQIGSPAPVFGPVPQVLPPGLVLNFGMVRHPDGRYTPIRFLHFEQRRIVIDVASESNTIDLIFEQLAKVLTGAQTTMGPAVIHEPERVRDYSEITARCSFDPSAVLAGPLVPLLSPLRNGMPTRHPLLMPTLILRFASPDSEYAGLALPDPNIMQFEIRSGTRPSDHIYFSAAPVDTTAHQTMLEQIDANLTAAIQHDSQR